MGRVHGAPQIHRAGPPSCRCTCKDRYGIRAGKVQMAIDCSVVTWRCGWCPGRVAWSVLAAVVMGVFLAVSHRPGATKLADATTDTKKP